MTVSNPFTPEQMRRMHIYGEAMTLISGRDPDNGDYTVDGDAVAEFMRRSRLHAQYIRELIGKPKEWNERDDYHDKIGWVCGDPPPERP